MIDTVAGLAADPSGSTAQDVVLRAENVHVEYDGERPTRAVRGVSFELRRGEVLGIAGESGCGKSTLAYAVTRMMKPPAQLTGGSVVFRDREGRETDLLALEGEELRAFRWNRLSMVFQSAMNALNPVTTVGRQFDDIYGAHRPEMTKSERAERTKALLEMVGIDAGRADGYPHELSGGMRQRVVIAMALALEPDVVIMDEPTTALDVVVQREILDEIERLREELGFSVIFITHDLGLLLEISDRLAVMYAGEIVEYAPAERLTDARHPYTQGLLRSFPDLVGERRELRGIPGSPPDLRGEVVGCAFADRCEYAFEPCRAVTPHLLDIAREGAAGWRAACHLNDPEHRSSVSDAEGPQS
ncbi:ABC transporter ATP-binding protein [Streptomyces himalayensis]|uniref:ABC transporter ATP-binding protein n=1 Tax=Streptomyces himalayensis subsp. himalayensis TaxID=2756131 RepID=A0A7W0DRY3_9ACTN|nr:ABC transporter ATP-binding protein [Streptomyces himalayensis]MBA2950172.1 ABC transporter ATP-binding protein [Streptomyces himalayensis subsp. himalayensis]